MSHFHSHDRRAWALLPLLLLAALACGGEDATTDAGPEPDGGPVETDGGPVETDGGELDGGPAATDGGAALTWENGMGPFFGEQCAGCHPWANTYDGVVAKILDGSMRIRAETGHRMTSDQAETLIAWIDAGYPEN